MVMKNRVFSDGNGSSVENLSCGLPRHFPHQPNLQVCLLLSRILSRNQLFVCLFRQIAESTMSFNRKLNEDRRMRIPYIGNTSQANFL